MAKLRKAGLVSARKNGICVYYELADPLPRQIQVLLESIVPGRATRLWPSATCGALRCPTHPTRNGKASTAFSGAMLAVYGHINRPYVKGVGDFTVGNTGSVGLPYDGDPRASCPLVDDLVPAVRRVEFDLDEADSDALAAGFPLAAWLSEVQHQAPFRSP